MRKTNLIAAVLVAASLVPARASAWGFAGHQLIMKRAIELLPPELKPLFKRYRDEVVIRVKDPDLWRNAGWEDDPNHFVDFGMKELGEYPFAELPREYGAALEKFGPSLLSKIGKLPWREAEEFGNLRRGFEGFKREGRFAQGDVVLFAAVASHYIQDAHQPFHASNNYDGALTGNTGIHARFETDLIERFESRLTLTSAATKAIANPRDAAFDVLLASYKLVDPILKADTESVAGKDTYDDDYYEKFFTKVRPILEQRLSQAITATASIIIGAWEQAGRPVIKLDSPRTGQKVKKPF
jgi:hypothetical protein